MDTAPPPPRFPRLIRAIALAGLLAGVPVADATTQLGTVVVRGHRVSGPWYAPRTHDYGWRWGQDCNSSACVEDWTWDWIGDPHPTEALPTADTPPAPPDGSCPDLNADWLTAGCTQESLLPRDVGEGHISNWVFATPYGLRNQWLYPDDLRQIRERVNFYGDDHAAVIAVVRGDAACQAAANEVQSMCFENYPSEIMCYQFGEYTYQQCAASFFQLWDEWNATLPFHIQHTQIVRTCKDINDQRVAGNCQF